MTSITSEKKIKYYPILDLVRFIAALLIISIHVFPEGSSISSVGLDNSIPTLVGESFAFALTRVAVPIFFVISSFLLFKQIDLDPENKWKYIKKFCLRILFLYLFWFIVGLPINIRDIYGFVSSGDHYELIRYIVNFFLKGAPRGFWFLVSLVVCILFTTLFKTKKSLTILIVISIVMYILGCLNSAYFGVFTLSNDPFSNTMFKIGNYLELYCSHLEALVFVVLGRIFASHDSFKIKGNIIYIFIIFFFMVGELFLTLYFNLFVFADAFFFLPVFVFFFMNKMISLNIENESFTNISRKLKRVGSFSYLFHIQFFYYMHWILDSTGHNIFRENIYLLVIPYLVCILLSFGLQSLCECLAKYKYLKFLKYSY